MSASTRRVTFQDIDAPRRRLVGLTRLPAVKPRSSSAPSSILKTKSKSVTVLHGRVVRQHDDGTRNHVDNCNNILASTIARQPVESSSRPTSIRAIMERKATFYKLTDETQQFQKLVSKLERVIRDDSQSMETAWRVKVLLKAAQETDKTLWNKLYEFEKTLLSNYAKANQNAGSDNNHAELSAAQTSCMKLHRDFKHSHKALLMCLSLINKKTATPRSAGSEEIGQLGAVGWTIKKVVEEEEEFGRDSPESTYVNFQELKKRQQRSSAVDVDEHGDFHCALEDSKEEIPFPSASKDSPIDEDQCNLKPGYICGAIGFEGLDDESMLESGNLSWYKYLREDISFVRQEFVRVGEWLDGGAFESEYASRCGFQRQASF